MSSRSGMLEADYRDADIGTSAGELLSKDEYEMRAQDRRGLSELDAMTAASARLTSRQRQAAFVLPRDATAPLNPAKSRRVPEYDEIRSPLSGRQMKERSRLKRQVQDAISAAEDRMLKSLVTPQTWGRLNPQLSAVVGDIDQMSTRDRASVKRIDRVIARYEQGSDRDHVLYAVFSPPAGLTTSQLAGEVVHLDRFTIATHQLHEVKATQPGNMVFEIITRRGMYLGQSDGGDDTSHLLPRSMEFTVESVHDARYRDRNGNIRSHQVIRLIDNQGEPS